MPDSSHPQHVGLLPPVATWTLDATRLAEQEIRKAQAQHPMASHLLHAAFPLLRPDPALFHGKLPALLRAHMSEVLDRIASSPDSADIGRATRAEVLLHLSDLSLRGPLRGPYVDAFVVCFAACLGETTASHAVGTDGLRRAEIAAEDQEVLAIFDDLGRVAGDPSRQRAWRAIRRATG